MECCLRKRMIAVVDLGSSSERIVEVGVDSAVAEAVR